MREDYCIIQGNDQEYVKFIFRNIELAIDFSNN